MLVDWQESGPVVDTYPRVLGVLDRKDLFRSAALLVLHSEKDDDRFGDEHPLWDELFVRSIDDAALYRMLLLRCGRGGPGLVAMDDEEVRRYREPDQGVAFRDVVKLRKRLRGGSR